MQSAKNDRRSKQLQEPFNSDTNNLSMLSPLQNLNECTFDISEYLLFIRLGWQYIKDHFYVNYQLSLKTRTQSVKFRKVKAVIDSIPAAHEDIDEVTHNQSDTVEVVH